MSLTKSKINLLIDAIMFFCMITITGIGFLIRYILLPGYKRNEIYGQNADLSFLGLDRHQWGTIHLVIGIVFCTLLIVHLVLHRQLINAVFCRTISNKPTRRCIAVGALLLALLFIIGPFLISPNISSHQSNHFQKNEITDHQFKENTSAHPDLAEIDVRGSMTLNEVAEKYQLPISVLTTGMNIAPQDATEKIGRLRKKYGFNITELKQLVKSNKKQ